LLHPSGELSFVELVVLADVEVAHFLLRGLAGRTSEQELSVMPVAVLVFDDPRYKIAVDRTLSQIGLSDRGYA
jgi:hypothetical protein